MTFRTELTRRHLLQGAAFIGLAAAPVLAFGLPLPALAQQADTATVPLDKLMAEPPLPDMWMGSKDAPVTIIEYASMTCTHCAAFHAETWPTLKSKYIDTGKVRFVLREFPLDPVATAAFMLARCAGPEKRNALVDLLFDQQKNWAFVDKPADALAATVRQAGISQAQFDTCLRDQDLLKKVNAERDAADKDFVVNATPTFFINGKKQAGEITVAELDKIIGGLIKG